MEAKSIAWSPGFPNVPALRRKSGPESWVNNAPKNHPKNQLWDDVNNGIIHKMGRIILKTILVIFHGLRMFQYTASSCWATPISGKPQVCGFNYARTLSSDILHHKKTDVEHPRNETIKERQDLTWLNQQICGFKP